MADLDPVAPDEEAVRRQADDPVELHRLRPSGCDAGSRVAASMIRKTSASGRPSASWHAASRSCVRPRD